MQIVIEDHFSLMLIVIVILAVLVGALLVLWTSNKKIKFKQKEHTNKNTEISID
jgi:hypothetical protein